MSEKKTVKPAPKTDAAKENKKPTVVGTDGNVRPIRNGEVLKEVDGKVVSVPKDEAAKELLAANGMLISVESKGVGVETYGLKVKRCDNGNILLAVETNDKPDGGYVIPKKDECANGLHIPDHRGIRVVGRRDCAEAMYAIISCYEAYMQGLGIADANAYVLVRLELHNLGNGMKWYGLFVPTLKVMGE